MESIKNQDIKIDDELIHATVKLNTLLFALVLALICGFSLFGITYIELAKKGQDPASFLNLLGVFLPGYQVTTSGAWVGLFWGFVIGAIAGIVVYRIYAKSIKAQVIEYLNSPHITDESLGKTTLTISGHSIGLALGALLALALFISTSWLVIRGTASESYNAALLGNYLPGYSVDFMGSIIGSVEIFIIVYVFCQVLSIVYNRVSSARNRGA